MHVKIFHKGWRDGRLYCDAVNQSTHELHDAAYPVHLRSFMAYEPGDVVFEAFAYNIEWDDVSPNKHLSGEELDRRVCSDAFDRFNIGEDEIAQAYRARRNRSLSVGDVVVIDGRAYGCASFGWDKLDGFEPTLAEH